MRFINADDKLLRAELFTYTRDTDMKSAINAIDKSPTIDAVEVVRCKDCKWWQDSEVGVVEYPICTRIHDMVFEMGADGYCSKGERKEEKEVEE